MLRRLSSVNPKTILWVTDSIAVFQNPFSALDPGFMIIIGDRVAGPKTFPFLQFLEEISRDFGLLDTDWVRIERVGGPGQKIWSIESILDAGDAVVVPYADLKSLALSGEDFLDELLCIHDRVVFGISDASFMFVQGQDKGAERLLASKFHDVKEIPNHDFS